MIARSHRRLSPKTLRDGEPPMSDFIVDPGWYEAYWYGDRLRSERRSLSGNLARLAVLVVLLAGSGLVLDHFHDQQPTSGYQDWEVE
jgi:hypothetical protein